MRHLLLWLVTIVAILSAVPGRATVLVPADLGELARGATAIVRGRVEAVRVEWADGRRRVLTIVTLEVQETYKGDLGSTVSFGVPGGTLGRYRTVMVGAPSFREGEEVVVFLAARAPALPHLVGFGQGVYRVFVDSRTGGTRVIPPALTSDSEGTVRVSRGDPFRREVSVEEFATKVRLALAPPGKTDRQVAPPRRERVRGLP